MWETQGFLLKKLGLLDQVAQVFELLGRNPGPVKVQGDPHSANFACQNRETALQMSR